MKTEVHRKKRTTKGKEKRGQDEKNTRVRLGCRRLKDFITAHSGGIHILFGNISGSDPRIIDIMVEY